MVNLGKTGGQVRAKTGIDIIAHLRGLDFVIRTGGNTHVRSAEFVGRMDELVPRRGAKIDIADAVMRPSRPVSARLVGVWARGCKEPWVLMTNLEIPAHQVVALYAKRFRIEEAFRDQKDWRYGMRAGHILVRSAARVERVLLVASLALFLALLVGAAARLCGLDRVFRANTVRTRPTHSDFALGIYYARRRRWRRSILFENFYLEGWAVFGG